MNFITRTISNITRVTIGNCVKDSGLSLVKSYSTSLQGNLFNTTRLCLNNIIQGCQQIRNGTSLWQMHRRGPKKRKEKKRILDGNPFAKGVVLKVLIKKPKKPNSANRKCVMVRLSNGKEKIAYIPGEGHNLQEHNVVLVRVGRTKDVPGLKLKCVRGKYDLPHVIKKTE
ncbi:small ribosomal subunit protein uS12m [Prorops nasuta]|uniref:small ribosomal subunit protein uS12m n=1 Tax=Prorops nasuta TaxID=863751 RepID=UPI0034CFC553